MTTTLKALTSLLLLVSVAFVTSPAHAKKIRGVELAETATIGGDELMLNGAGVRTKLILKLYVGSLYTTAKSNDAAAILDADEPMAIRLNIISDLLTKKKMVKSLKAGFKKSTGGNTAAIQPQIDQMLGLMQGKIGKKDQYTLNYKPGSGTRVTKNGEEVGVVEGLEFKKALFGIWLSDNPAQSSLKAGMLGK
ncbi:MAG: chalcone isomerase family protein [Granulosicoccaceae bacterium]